MDEMNNIIENVEVTELEPVVENTGMNPILGIGIAAGVAALAGGAVFLARKLFSKRAREERAAKFLEKNGFSVVRDDELFENIEELPEL